MIWRFICAAYLASFSHDLELVDVQHLCELLPLSLFLLLFLFYTFSSSFTLIVYKQSAKFALAQLIVFHMVSFAGKDISVYHCNITDDCLLLTLKIIIKQAYHIYIYTYICNISETPAILWVMKGKIPTRFIYMQWYLKWEDWTQNVYMNKRNLWLYFCEYS